MDTTTDGITDAGTTPRTMILAELLRHLELSGEDALPQFWD